MNVLGLWLLPQGEGCPPVVHDAARSAAAARLSAPLALMQFTMTPQLTLLLISAYVLL